jgi:hypothetical protein
MPASNSTASARLAIMRASGVPVSSGDAKRIEESVTASLEALDSAIKGSLFDTEPQNFDLVLRKLAKAR